MKVSKRDQIQMRRNSVWDLHSQGLTQNEIADRFKRTIGLEISRQTISNDIIYMKGSLAQKIIQSTEQVTEEYFKVLSNLEQLRKLAWHHMYNAQKDEVRLSLYSIIQDINADILHIRSLNDVLKEEVLLQKTKKHAQETKEKMEHIVAPHSDNQAIFQ